MSVGVGLEVRPCADVPPDLDRFDRKQDAREFLHPFIFLVALLSSPESEDSDVGEENLGRGMRGQDAERVGSGIHIACDVDVSEVNVQVGDARTFGMRQSEQPLGRVEECLPVSERGYLGVVGRWRGHGEQRGVTW